MSSQTVKQRSAAPKSNDTAASPKKALHPTAAEDGPRWLSSNPSKRTGELFFIAYSVIWVVVFGAGIVATEVYHVRHPLHPSHRITGHVSNFRYLDVTANVITKAVHF